MVTLGGLHLNLDTKALSRVEVDSQIISCVGFCFV